MSASATPISAQDHEPPHAAPITRNSEEPMKATVRVPADFGGVDGGYGLGLMMMRTPCGTVWGHGGDTIGHHSTAVVSADGRRAAVTDTTTQPAIAEGLTPGAEAMIEASKRAELAATCAMYGKPVPLS